jgi:ABC-type transport system involved in multi-copper enzyme maturation permease subunit
VAFVLAHLRGVPTAAWTSSAGIADLTRALGDLVLGTVGFATFGLVVGLLFRSSVAAIIVGFVWLLPFENIVVRIVPQTASWLPGQLLQFLAEGGSTTADFSHSLVLSGLYLLVAMGAATIVFQRKDVTA